MADSVQERVIKNVVATMGRIAGIQTVQRLNQGGVDLAAVPTILVKEGDCIPELGKSVAPSVMRRMELIAVIIVQQDETDTSADTRSGAEQLNDYTAKIEQAIAGNRTWDGVALQTDPPSYLEVEMDAVVPHLARGLRFEVLYEHLRVDPYQQVH